MILRQKVLEGIRSGTINVAFRRWTRPTVKSGGTLLTAIGQLAIRSVTQIDPSEITEDDSINAGFPDRDSLLAELDYRTDGEVYRIELGELLPDPRIALRAKPMDADSHAEVKRALARLDERSSTGPWTMETLRVIETHPEVRAVELARMLGQERDPFKTNVRKLKRLGLTESLEIGYRISPRGREFLDHAE